jgi:hypothetical protein
VSNEENIRRCICEIDQSLYELKKLDASLVKSVFKSASDFCELPIESETIAVLKLITGE